MDYFKISSAMGGEYEFSNNTPPDLDYEKLPGSKLHYVSGPWGHMVFQHVESSGVAVWYSQYFLNCAIDLTGSANIPVTELHNSVENYFTSNWDGIGQPTEKAGQGGFSHSPFIHNRAFFPAANIYRTFDFHFEHHFFDPYLDAYPKLYKMLNHAERKEPNHIDTLLKLDPDLKVIINQIKRFAYLPIVHDRYFHLKSEEFLIGALQRMHPAKETRHFSYNSSLKKKAEDLKVILEMRFADPLSLAELARLSETNVSFICLAFKERYQMTIFQYIRTLRMEHAKELLLNRPELGMEAIAIEVQLYDAARFANAFKEYYGISPSEFRKSGNRKK